MGKLVNNVKIPPFSSAQSGRRQRGKWLRHRREEGRRVQFVSPAKSLLQRPCSTCPCLSRRNCRASTLPLCQLMDCGRCCDSYRPILSRSLEAEAMFDHDLPLRVQVVVRFGPEGELVITGTSLFERRILCVRKIKTGSPLCRLLGQRGTSCSNCA